MHFLTFYLCTIFLLQPLSFFSLLSNTNNAAFQINTTTHEKDRSNPFRFANIGVEKFLELNSEQNHDDYCLAYVFTDRDFDDGVLGLAWVGAPAGKYLKILLVTVTWFPLIKCQLNGCFRALALKLSIADAFGMMGSI